MMNTEIPAKAKGLGDTIARITSATGVDKLVKHFFDDCGCDKRRADLNKVLPYKKNQCFTQQQFEEYYTKRERLSMIFKDKGTLTREDVSFVYQMHFKVFGHPRKQPCVNCNDAWKAYLRLFNALEEKYSTQFDDMIAHVKKRDAINTKARAKRAETKSKPKRKKNANSKAKKE